MINVLIGIISGIVSGMGMGGGTILILCLSLFLGKDQHIAQGANLVFFVPTSIVAIIMNVKQKLIKWKTGITVSICGIVRSINRSKDISKSRYKQIKTILWNLFVMHSCI